MGIIVAIVIGFVVGLIARAIMPGTQSMGFIFTTLLGVAGSIVGTEHGKLLGWYGPGDEAQWIGSIVGAIILLFLYGLIAKKR